MGLGDSLGAPSPYNSESGVIIPSTPPPLLNGTNEKSHTRIRIHSHLLQQLGLRRLDVGSAG